ncbi:ubiquitin, partial [Rhodotorula toruloides]
IEVAIKTLTGTTYDISINPCATVRALKEPFQKHEGTSPNQQRLIFAGKELKDEKTLPECGIEDGGVLHFVLRMRG